MTSDTKLELDPHAPPLELTVEAPVTVDDTVAALRADFEAKFLERFGSDPNPHEPLKRRVVSAWVREWAFDVIDKANK